MRFEKTLLTLTLLLTSAAALGQANGVPPADLLKPLKDTWPTYNGDYTARRYSALTQVNRTTVRQLTLAWMKQVSPGAGDPTGAGDQSESHDKPSLIIGGEGSASL